MGGSPCIDSFWVAFFTHFFASEFSDVSPDFIVSLKSDSSFGFPPYHVLSLQLLTDCILVMTRIRGRSHVGHDGAAKAPSKLASEQQKSSRRTTEERQLLKTMGVPNSTHSG